MLGLCVLLTMGAVNAALNMTYLLASLLIAGFQVALIMPLWSLRGLRCTRAIQGPPHAGEAFAVTLWVSSTRRTPTRFVVVEEPLAGATGRGRNPLRRLVASIAPGERVALACVAPAMRRGVHVLPGLRWSSRFPFGVAENAVQSRAGGELVVYPARGRLNARTLAALRTKGIRTGVPAQSGLEGEDFRSLREYRPGDNPRRIHWRSSARLGQVYVREMEYERSAPVLIVLDSRLPGSLSDASREGARQALETAISFAAEVSREALARGCGVTLVALFPEARAVTAAPCADAMTTINEALARLTPAADESAEALGEAAQEAGIASARRVIAVSPVVETARGLRAALRGYAAQCHVAGDPGFAAVFSMAATGGGGVAMPGEGAA